MSYFWSGYVLKNFIFFNFNTTTIPGFIGVFIALFSLGFLFEALFYLKKHLLQRFLQFQLLKRKRSSIPSSASTAFTPLQPSLEDESPSSLSIPNSDNPRNSLLGGAGDGDHEDGHDTVDIDTSSSPIPPSFYLLISSMVHALYAFLGYTLMNAVMTFNLWVLVSICTGIGLGYLIFRTEYPHFPSITSRSPQNPQNQVGIETDDDDDDLTTRQPKTENGSRGSSLYKKSPGSPAGSSSRSSSSRRSRNRVRAAQLPGDTESPSENLVKIENGVEPQALLGGGGPPVIVVGAQVHSTYQQSV